MFELLNILEISAGEIGSCDGLGPIITIIKAVFGIIQILVPIGLILFGAIDLGKAVISSDEKEIKGATGKLLKRAIAGAAVFFTVAIVNVVMGLVAKAGADSNKWAECWNSSN